MTISASAAEGTASGSYLFDLADFTGSIPFGSVAVSLDDERNEVYVCDMSQRSVRVFNDQGMEIFRFGENEDMGAMYDLAVQENGDILLLSYRRNIDTEAVLIRCNYRGEPVARFGISGLPEEFSRLRPYRLLLHEGRLFLADLHNMLVVETTLDGTFVEGHDLGASVGFSRQEVASAGMGGFDIDAEGNFLFSVPVMFKVFRIAPGGEGKGFGEAGSTPGKFGVVSGIAAGRNGEIYVVDTLRCVVMAFDANFRLLTEFGYRHAGPGGLAAPRGLAVSKSEKVYVTQSSKRGVSVFRINYN